MIEFNQHIIIKSEAGKISEAGMVAVRDWIWAQKLREGEWPALNPASMFDRLPSLPIDWDWTWILQRGEYRGTFPKRVSAHYHKKYGLKCPASFLAELGNLAHQHSESRGGYEFEFVKELNWNAGDFGDGGSCYWWNGRQSLDVLMENSAFAVCFYANGKGFGRAWLYEVKSGIYILWNGYGYHTMTIARVLSDYLKVTYRQIPLSNYGEISGTVYINGGYGYIIGRSDAIAHYDDYDFEFETYEYRCYECGEIVHEETTYTGSDGNDYCEHCYDSLFSTCDHCYDVHPSDDFTYVRDTSEYVCDPCFDRYFSPCHKCDVMFLNTNLVTIEDELYCQGCADKLESGESDENEE